MLGMAQISEVSNLLALSAEIARTLLEDVRLNKLMVRRPYHYKRSHSINGRMAA